MGSLVWMLLPLKMTSSLFWINEPLTLLTMMEEVLVRSQGIFDFNPEAQTRIGEVVILCTEIRETLVDLTVENRLTQSYLRLLHSLLSSLGEGLSAAGEGRHQVPPRGAHGFDIGDALVWVAQEVEYWLLDDRGPEHLGSVDLTVNKSH